ncbi:MAG: hypothetical protein GF353_15895 [Candidatus Lokiarchaeota archaeon]|nr:hypothetical protein [Candidatus Lokiarchaeota archaeon]
MKSNLNMINKREVLKIDPDKIKNFVIKMKKYFSEKFSQFSKINSIVLFGSYALKNCTEESDIDLCIIFKQNTPRDLEKNVFDKILNLSREIKKLIDVIFIFPELIESIDHTLLESILAEGKVLFGNEEYKDLLIKNIKLEPYRLVKFNLKKLTNKRKMKFKRMLYGYKTSRKYYGKTYHYYREGLIHELRGIKLSSGAILVPEKVISTIQARFKDFKVNYSSFRVWKQKI